jgi:hypothetical protein
MQIASPNGDRADADKGTPTSRGTTSLASLTKADRATKRKRRERVIEALPFANGGLRRNESSHAQSNPKH